MNDPGGQPVLGFGGAVWLLGHLALCVAVWNRLHALPLHHRVLKLFELPLGAWLFSAPWLATAGSPYAISCCLFLAWAVIERVRKRWWGKPAALRAESIVLVDVARELSERELSVRGRSASELSAREHSVGGTSRVSLAGDWVGRWCEKLPGNEIFSLEIAHKTVAIPGLPTALDRLVIAHLSDLHMTGHVARAYFEFQVEQANAAQPDIAVITGDILDNWTCREWIGETLGRLRARYGVFFILGNHDLRPGPPAELRRLMESFGLVDVGNRTTQVAIRGVDVAITGNERPWFQAARDVAAPPAKMASGPFRILLSHSPDQIDWAIRQRFPLMLAGHTHGGQIVFPVIGPVVSPSLYGTKYACGLFQVSGVVMHVSRGLSGEEPVRWNCPPELAILTLVSA
ncbi:MAG: metallophosphoesterase [Planctomycetota bacterium]